MTKETTELVEPWEREIEKGQTLGYWQTTIHFTDLQALLKTITTLSADNEALRAAPAKIAGFVPGSSEASQRVVVAIAQDALAATSPDSDEGKAR